MMKNLNEMSITELEVHANELFSIWQDIQSEYAFAAHNSKSTETVAELARQDAIAETAYDNAFTLLQARTFEMLAKIKARKLAST